VEKFGCRRSFRDISTSLVRNITLKKLCIQTRFDVDFWNPNFLNTDKLLCDVSSIESIFNSNHTLRWITVSGHRLSTFAEDYLELNRQYQDKAEVIRTKILRFYFIGEFDVSPFVNMPLSVLPQIMSQIEKEDY
jgi:hypothetical protein